MGEHPDSISTRGAATEPTRIAVIVPCHNEEATVAAVVTGFLSVLPGSVVYVFDNMSTDDTAQRALAAGAVVVPARRPGKGSVVRKMFSEVDADIYLMVDGDTTYEVAAAPAMIELLQRDALDMVIGARVPAAEDGEEYPAGHTLGNRVFSMLYRRLFESDIDDAFSGYRAMSRRFVKSFPATTSGFDIETELLAHAAELKLEFDEIPVKYYSRPEGSQSKLGTYSDGIKILWSAIRLFRDLRPKRFFGIGAVLATVAALVLGIPVIEEYLDTGLVLRFPTAILAMGLQLLAFLLLTCGLIISSVRQGSREQRRLAYLAVPQPSPRRRNPAGVADLTVPPVQRAADPVVSSTS